MDECPAPEDQILPFITGGDWSVGLNSTTSLDQLVLLHALGRRLRREYQNLIEAPISERLTMLVEQLEKGSASGVSFNDRPNGATDLIASRA